MRASGSRPWPEFYREQARIVNAEADRVRVAWPVLAGDLLDRPSSLLVGVTLWHE
jgi:hypothetical protein